MMRGYGCTGAEVLGRLLDVARMDRDVSRLVVEYMSSVGWWVRLGCFDDPTRVTLMLEPDWYVCDLPRFPVRLPIGLTAVHFIPSTGHLYVVIKRCTALGYVLDMNSSSSGWEPLAEVSDDTYTNSTLLAIDADDDTELRVSLDSVAIPYAYDPISKQWNKQWSKRITYEDQASNVNGVHWTRAKSLMDVDKELFRLIPNSVRFGPLHLQRTKTMPGMYLPYVVVGHDFFDPSSGRQCYQSLCLDTTEDFYAFVFRDNRSVSVKNHVLRFTRTTNTWHDLGEPVMPGTIGAKPQLEFPIPLSYGGSWISTIVYNRYDVAYANGKYFVCLSDNTNTNPAFHGEPYWMWTQDVQFSTIHALAALTSAQPTKSIKPSKPADRRISIVLSHRDDLKLIEYATTAKESNSITASIRKISERIVSTGGPFRPEHDHFIALPVPYC